MSNALATQLLKGWLAACLGCLMCITSAQAHWMTAQQGTLNIVGEAAFMVLSVPVSAFTAVDDDGDGALSKAELVAHAGTVRQQLKEGVQLFQGEQALPLYLMMVDVVGHDNALEAPSAQLMVMGRFQMRDGSSDGAPERTRPDNMRLHFNLFGRASDEQAQDIRITRQEDAQTAHFTPERTTRSLFPGGLTRLLEGESPHPEQALLVSLAAGGAGLLMIRVWRRRRPLAFHIHSKRSTEAQSAIIQ
jgi:hypothetical protein